MFFRNFALIHQCFALSSFGQKLLPRRIRNILYTNLNNLLINLNSEFIPRIFRKLSWFFSLQTFIWIHLLMGNYFNFGFLWAVTCLSRWKLTKFEKLSVMRNVEHWRKIEHDFTWDYRMKTDGRKRWGEEKMESCAQKDTRIICSVCNIEIFVHCRLSDLLINVGKRIFWHGKFVLCLGLGRLLHDIVK